MLWWDPVTVGDVLEVTHESSFSFFLFIFFLGDFVDPFILFINLLSFHVLRNYYVNPYITFVNLSRL